MRSKREREEERIRVCAEDLLKAAVQRHGPGEDWTAGELGVAESGQTRDGLELLEREGYAEATEDRWRLTKKGRQRAVELVRAHRLMETYLARQEGRPARELHDVADAAEHYLTTEGVNALADEMKRPRYDPHGDPIPERAKDLFRQDERSLTEANMGERLVIAHIEDEPRADFERLLDLGLAPELAVEVTDQGPAGTEIELAGERIRLTPELALHIEVVSFPEGLEFPEGLRRLSALKPGESGYVEYISPACMGPERWRLLDFGMVPGSEVSCEFPSPFGSPMAYSVRGTTLGLRKSQARKIFIRRKK